MNFLQKTIGIIIKSFLIKIFQLKTIRFDYRAREKPPLLGSEVNSYTPFSRSFLTIFTIPVPPIFYDTLWQDLQQIMV